MDSTQNPASQGLTSAQAVQMAKDLMPTELPSAEQVYCYFMSQIEPDLLPFVVPLQKEMYKDETPEQAKSREERYKKAFVEYDRVYAVYAASLHEKSQSYQRLARESAEQEVLPNEQSNINAILSDISHTS